MSLPVKHHPASYKDKDGYVVLIGDKCHRVIGEAYYSTYKKLMLEGLYKRLVDKAWLIPHEETDIQLPGAGVVLAPQQVPFVSYPYEWSFGQLKDAAILTLDIQLAALEAGMSLKDASAFNVQFIGASPVFIDTSSFEVLDLSLPWKAYGQFCRHFLAPLALMAHTDLRLGALLSANIDGIPLDLCSRLLPFSTRFNLGLLTHIHGHAKAISRYQHQNKEVKPRTTKQFSVTSLKAIISHLRSTISGLRCKPQKTTWDDYYIDNNNYTLGAFDAKKNQITAWLGQLKPALSMVWDIGANDGTFSRLAAKEGVTVVAMDIDPNAVDANYLKLQTEPLKHLLLPLVVDLANPSTARGWAGVERASVFERKHPDLIMGLALIHHLAIGLNLPFDRIADFFAGCTRKYLIIEFVEPNDSQVEKLLRNRKGQFPDYERKVFESAFAGFFNTKAVFEIPGAQRALYLMEKVN